MVIMTAKVSKRKMLLVLLLLVLAAAVLITCLKRADTPDTSQDTAEEIAEVAKEVPKKSHKKKKPVVQLEEEEFLSEEDLQAAEDEFMNGPAGRRNADEAMSED